MTPEQQIEYQQIMGFVDTGHFDIANGMIQMSKQRYATRPQPAPEKAGLNHFGIELATSEFENTVAHLEGRDIIVKESGHLQDPDGVTIRLSGTSQ